MRDRGPGVPEVPEGLEALLRLVDEELAPEAEPGCPHLVVTAALDGSLRVQGWYADGPAAATAAVGAVREPGVLRTFLVPVRET